MPFDVTNICLSCPVQVSWTKLTDPFTATKAVLSFWTKHFFNIWKEHFQWPLKGGTCLSICASIKLINALKPYGSSFKLKIKIKHESSFYFTSCLLRFQTSYSSFYHHKVKFKILLGISDWLWNVDIFGMNRLSMWACNVIFIEKGIQKGLSWIEVYKLKLVVISIG